jgi:hypothetical protein
MWRAWAAPRLRQIILASEQDYAFAADRTGLSTFDGTIFALFDQSLHCASIGVRNCVTALQKWLAARMGEEALSRRSL